MGRAAVIRDGIVENIIIAEPGFDLGDGTTIVQIGDEAVGVGYAYDGERFTPCAVEAEPMPEEKPDTVTQEQLRQALEHVGMTSGQAKALIEFAQTLGG